MKNGVAIVGMACRFPDANSPAELWENVLAQRRGFRRMPAERLRAEDYFSENRNAPDKTYSFEAAVIEGFEFDRVSFRVAGSTYRSADMAHWLALDTAARALADAGFAEAEGLPRDATGVLLGNTLTGEFSRAAGLRLRWPYARRVIESALSENGWAAHQRDAFLQELETSFKKPFAPVGEDTLAGGLSNTIAGRICNYFNLRGGGYTVDGACSASLLSVITACNALVSGDMDVALAGGVDLSLDPFELVGFAKTSALAQDEMRVYDARSSGFWPGEGCGFVALMRHEDAIAQGRKIYAVIQGWGISSDGSGGITRPEVDGQLLALRRAYRRAGFGIDTVGYFEGHGTGTAVGDMTEIRALSQARREANMEAPPAALGSVKANIGHTKAAAGIAGLIKASMALNAQILPPTSGCYDPHPDLLGKKPALRALKQAEPWPDTVALRASVSAMGFGGINSHVVLENIPAERRKSLGARERALTTSYQDAELFLIGARDQAGLLKQVEHLLGFAQRLSRGEITDLAAALETTLDDRDARAAIVASSPAQFHKQLQMLRAWLIEETLLRLDIKEGVFLNLCNAAPRIGFLFPGQGSPANPGGGALRNRFEFVQDLYFKSDIPAGSDLIATATAQPAIVTASLAALRALDRFNIRADIGIGHSLGELSALHWSGAFDEQTLLRIATVRGNAMARLGDPDGAMASLAVGREDLKQFLNGGPVVIAGLNSPKQTVISGKAEAVAAVVAQARSRGIAAVMLPVSHAFHSPLVMNAAPALGDHLASEQFWPLQKKVISTVTGAALPPDQDITALLCSQITCPVRFYDAVTAAGDNVDLWIEAGPGHVLSDLLENIATAPSIALDASGPSLKGLLKAVAAAFTYGLPVNHGELFAGRFAKPFNLDWRPSFLINPCELAPISDDSREREDFQTQKPEASEWENSLPLTAARSETIQPTAAENSPQSPLELTRHLMAQWAELPVEAVKDESRLLSDLHLNSITVGQIVAEAARRLGLPPPISPTDYANVTVAEVAQALDELARTGGPATAQRDQQPQGVASWVRCFSVENVERPLPHRKPSSDGGEWTVFAPPEYPFASALKRELDKWGGGGGYVVCLPQEPDERHLGLLLESAHTVLSANGPTRFVLLQHGGGAAAFARTLHLESSDLTTCVVDIPPRAEALDWALAEIKVASGYSEAHYSESGERFEPVLRLHEMNGALPEQPLDASDVLVVTGGGKGITAECAISLAKDTSAALVLIGLSQPDSDVELAATLERMQTLGLTFKYLVADVTDRAAVESALNEARESFGPITAIIHGAAINIPERLQSLEEELLRRTVATKLQGARNLLAAVDPARLKLFVTFSSIIARTGLPGEAHYGLANEWVTRLTRQFKTERPACRCLAIEWSVWSGVGMAQRLGGVDRLAQAGIMPITPDQGVEIFKQLVTQDLPGSSIVVTGRYGELPTLQVERPELPLYRFIEAPRIYYPGVELVADAELSVDSDPYLSEHIYEGRQLVPAVLGLEAMAQAAMALTGSTRPPVFEEAEFVRAIVVPDRAPLTIRAAALVTRPGIVEVALRSEETDFQVNHFRAVCRIVAEPLHALAQTLPLPELNGQPRYLPVVPERDLYGSILFHKGRFQRLRGYLNLDAISCLAEIKQDANTGWFGQYLPPSLVLGNPSVRDAAIHSIQACIPHATLLPIGAERIEIADSQVEGPVFVSARERSREGNTFTYDFQLSGEDGRVWERWQGLQLRRVSNTATPDPWPEHLLAAYIERRVGELIPGCKMTAALGRVLGLDRKSRSDEVIRRALRRDATLVRGAEGKPELATGDGVAVSAAHTGDLTLAVTGPAPVSCDIEPVTPRADSVWQDLLGPDRFSLAKVIAQEMREEPDAAATRVWAANECLKKAGLMANAPLALASTTDDGWALLSSGSINIATIIASVRGAERKLAVAALARRDDASF